MLHLIFENNLIDQVRTRFRESIGEIQDIYQTQSSELININNFNTISADTLEGLYNILNGLY